MRPYLIGILQSLTGTMSISESPLVDATLLAVEEINATGGILGRSIEAIIADGASDHKIFYQKAEQLILEQKIDTVFGCWTSLSRKAVKPLFEQHNAQLWYPVQYEGLEESQNIFYTGPCLNQQIQPAVEWLLAHGFKRFFLVGSDYVFPITAHKLIQAQLDLHEAALVGEELIPLGCTDFSNLLEKIQKEKPDIVFNTLNGDSNFDFYRQYAKSGIKSKHISIMAVSIAEVEVQQILPEAVGHLACWSYFESFKSEENSRFIKAYQA